MEMNEIYLPCEVISHIFRYLPVSDLKSSCLVCQCWREAADDLLLWRNVKICIFSRQTELSKRLLNSIKRRHMQHVKFRSSCLSIQINQVCAKIGSTLLSLDLEGCRCLANADGQIIANILSNCGNLRHLNLSGCRQLDLQYKWMNRSKSELVKLESLILNSCKNSIKALFEMLHYEKFESLTTLGISGCVSTKTMWQVLASECKQLTSLDISRCEISDEELTSLAAASTLKLKELNLTACRNITDKGFDKLFEYQTSLQSLKLGCTEISNRTILKMTSSLSELKELELNSCRQLTDMRIFGRNVAFMNQLLYLNLYSCYQVSSSSLVRCFSGHQLDERNCNNCMQHLVLNGCCLLTDDALNTIAASLPNMRHLDLGSCLQITNQGVTAISKHMPHLKVLRLSWCSKITDTGILGQEETKRNDDQKMKDTKDSSEKMRWQGVKRLHGLRDLKMLENLDLSHCSCLTDEGLLALRELTSLTELNLSMCVQMTDATLTTLSRDLPCLEVLCLSGCNNLGEEGLKAASAHLGRLQFLDISKCDCITDSSLQYIAKHCRSLTHLDLNMCSEVINYGVDELESSLTQLASLHLRYSGVHTAEFHH